MTVAAMVAGTQILPLCYRWAKTAAKNCLPCDYPYRIVDRSGNWINWWGTGITSGPSWVRNFNLDLVTHDLNSVDFDLELSIVSPTSVAEMKSPTMPGARNSSIHQGTLREGCASMRAGVVNCTVCAAIIKDGDHTAIHCERPSFSFRNLINACYGLPMQHCGVPSSWSG
jgi:hypothetical protein